MTVLAFECQTLLWGGERKKERKRTADILLTKRRRGGEANERGGWLEEAERDAEAGTVTTGSSTGSERPPYALVGCVSV
ncbi:hypothetical protein QQF64_013302 [Cirrhinus molitorella]|uniref:Uncharacterized protein n=1 Tax=Cirrhinus molitorella TaxID=172907 RepID=A0ABR3LT09_9TELE